MFKVSFFFWHTLYLFRILKDKLKINDAKTEFIVFRSPMLKHDLSDMSVNVGGNLIEPSVKVRDLGVILDQTLSFDEHISAICQSAHFHIRNIGRIRNLLFITATRCSTTLQMQRLKDCKKCRIKGRAF